MHTSIQIALDTAWLSGSGLPRERGRALLRLLGELGRSASLREAAAAAALSYRSAWGLLGDAARLFGAPLVEMQRGRPARLSSLGERILQADARVRASLEEPHARLRAELGALLSDAGRRPGARLRLQGSHDLALEALRAACPPQLDLELLFRGADDSLAALARGECDLAGFHVADALPRAAAAAAALGRWLDPKKHTLIHFVARQQGLIARPGARIRSVHDLARPGVRFIHRQSSEPQRQAREQSVAAAVAEGRADAAFGLHADAKRFRLAFVPLSVERYFFACAKSAMRAPAVQALLATLRSERFAAAVKRLPGYDLSKSGQLEALDAALTWVERGRRRGHG
ncbi:MAG TPA: substrate-binding domain-containing protein [Burkholderiales bacterium]|nr:substrate-binding domain-containing protein [Burkholderiales bacterium]